MPSFQQLRENQARLFVFLADTPLRAERQRVFLPASDRCDQQPRIAWYALMLRGEHYDSQILFMYGFLNLPYDASNPLQFEEIRRPTVVP